MLSKAERRKYLKRTFRDLFRQLWSLRFERQLALRDLSAASGVPEPYLEMLEYRRSSFNMGYLCQLAAYYDMRIEIKLVPVEEEDRTKQ